MAHITKQATVNRLATELVGQHAGRQPENRDPVRTGIPMSQPISTGPQSKTSLAARNVTSTPFIIHAAKQTVNAMCIQSQCLVRLCAGYLFPRSATLLLREN